MTHPRTTPTPGVATRTPHRTTRADPFGPGGPVAGRASAYENGAATELVTGEAVTLDLPPVSVGPRVLAGLIDLVCRFALFVALALLALTAAARMSDAVAASVLVIFTVLCWIAIPTAVETLSRGKSVGKLILGLRVIRDDGGPVGFQQAFVRALVGYVEVLVTTGSAAVITAMLSTQGKRLGDYAAGTHVVRDRLRVALPAPVPMPPHLARWAATADVTSLPPGLTLAIRQLLTRWGQLTPQAREMTGAKLSGEVARHVAPPPPPGTTTRDFLAAVLASRRERDLARLHREEGLRQRLIAAGSADR